MTGAQVVIFTCDRCGQSEKIDTTDDGAWPNRPEGWRLLTIANEHDDDARYIDLCPPCTDLFASWAQRMTTPCAVGFTPGNNPQWNVGGPTEDRPVADLPPVVGIDRAAHKFVTILGRAGTHRVPHNLGSIELVITAYDPDTLEMVPFDVIPNPAGASPCETYVRVFQPTKLVVVA